jgi:hypothetical protein
MRARRQVTPHLLVLVRELSPSRGLGLAVGHRGHLLQLHSAGQQRYPFTLRMLMVAAVRQPQ